MTQVNSITTGGLQGATPLKGFVTHSAEPIVAATPAVEAVVEEAAKPIANFTVNQTPAEIKQAKAAAKEAADAAKKLAKDPKAAQAAAEAAQKAADEAKAVAKAASESAHAVKAPKVDLKTAELKHGNGKPISPKALNAKPHISIDGKATEAVATVEEAAKKSNWLSKVGKTVKDTYVHNEASIAKIADTAKTAGKEVKLPKMGGIRVQNALITAGALAVTGMVIAAMGNKGPGDKAREADNGRGQEASVGR